MAEVVRATAEFESHLESELAEKRLLTEVHHILDARQPDGSIRQEVLGGVADNLFTKVQEDAMPGAVTEVVQPVANVREESGKLRRTFIWKGLGRSALSVAESGYDYHFSKPAFMRVGVEVREARRSEESLRPGIVQSFVSPKMSCFDAPEYIAKQEHLGADDAVRVSSAVTDNEGNVVGRRTQSLLVRDIPLGAWVAMFCDPKNIFGKSFEISNDQSALSVMELFDQLDLPEEALPEGPVTLVENVLPYIDDPLNRACVEIQIDKFREDQLRLRAEAKAMAAEWLEFEVALAESLHYGFANFDIKRFMISMQTEWDDEMLAIINDHMLPGVEFRMTQSLAARLEQAKQKLIGRTAKVSIGAEDAIAELGEEKAAEVRREIEDIRLMRSFGHDPAEIFRRESMVRRTLAQANIRTGGGCGGANGFSFRSSTDPNGDFPGDPDGNLSLGLSQDSNTNQSSREEKIGKVKVDVCRVDGCPSRPAKTLVGGCSVCLKYCQPLFDAGKDPVKIFGSIITVSTEKKSKERHTKQVGIFGAAGVVAEAEAITRDAAKMATKEVVAVR